MEEAEELLLIKTLPSNLILGFQQNLSCISFKDYQRLKDDENSRLSLGWNLNREISKINYKIHTDAIKEYLLSDLSNEQLSYKYASEADMLNVSLFNKRSKQWHDENLDLKGNMRDYASINELLLLG